MERLGKKLNHNNSSMLKVLICGLGRHGKDTAAEFLRDSLGMRFVSSSMFACKNVVFPTMQAMYGYATPDECYSDRRHHRPEWYELIRNHTRYDPARLAREILKENDVYCGMRSSEEFSASKDLFTLTIWVDANDRLGVTEGTDSCSITKDMCDVVIDNNGSPEQMKNSLRSLFH